MLPVLLISQETRKLPPDKSFESTRDLKQLLLNGIQPFLITVLLTITSLYSSVRYCFRIILKHQNMFNL